MKKGSKTYSLLTVTVPEGWMPSFEACREHNGNTRAAELRQALYAHLVKNGFMSKGGKNSKKGDA